MTDTRRGLDRSLGDDLRAAIRDVPDFPKPGIVFKDITPVLGDPRLLRRTVKAMAAPFADAKVSYVVGVESRGFILGAPVALDLGAGFIPVRKPGKLPHRTAAAEYALEYGTDRLEIHADACAPDARVLVVDDVLATGGTASATCRLVETLGGLVVGCSFLICLSFLPGAAALANRRFESLVTY
jgi:adenine phosphoribosyltransferase